MKEGRNLSFQVIQGMYLDTTLMLAELSPPEDIQAQRDGRGIKSINVTVKFEDVCSSFASGLTDKVVCILLEDAIVTVGIGLAQITSGHVLAKSEMIALLVMCLNGDNQITHALAIAQLAKHQRKKLVPTCEVLHVFVASILANKIIEVIPVEKCYQLSENVLVLIHMQTILAAKIQKSSPLTQKKLCN